MGILSNIIASYLVGDILYENIFGVPIGAWLILTFLVITAIVSYTLVLTPEVTQTAIYANFMVNRHKNCLHLSPYGPWAIQFAELLWKALEKDSSPLAKQIIKNLHKADADTLTFDLLEHLIFQVLSGFHIFWASSKIKSYGYPTWPRRLGEITEFRPSTIYLFSKKQEVRQQEGDFEYKDCHSILERNQIVKHFLGVTQLEKFRTPSNWLLFTPKGTKISIHHKTHERTIRFYDCLCTVSITVRKESVGAGLPYGIRIKEKNYNEKKYFSTDFRIDVTTSFSRLLPIHPKVDDYHNWTQLILEKLIANFCLSRKGIIEEI